MDNPALDSSVVKTLAFNDYTVSAVALLWYDWCLTLDDEVAYIWKQKWTMGKWLYVLNRFIPLFDLLILAISYSDVTLKLSLCKPWWHIDTWLSIFNFLIMDIVLLLRTLALWNKKRNIFIILIVTFIVSAISTAGAALWASLHVTYGTSIDNIHPCSSGFPEVTPLYGIWAGLILFDSVVMILILIKAIPIFMSMPLSPTLKTFFQDGFLYYIIIFSAALANIFMITYAPGEIATSLFTFHRSMSSLLGSRMILNLRGAIMRPSAMIEMEGNQHPIFSGDASLSFASGWGNSMQLRSISRTGPEHANMPTSAKLSTRSLGTSRRASHPDLMYDKQSDDLDMDSAEYERSHGQYARYPADTEGVRVHVSTSVTWDDDSRGFEGKV